MLDTETLRSRYEYFPDTGKFRNRKTGRFVGCPNALGYLVIEIDHKQYLCHRLAWLYVYGRWPTEVDHIDQDKSNNKMENLREVSRSENIQNSGLRADNTSGAKGVSFDLRRSNWRAYYKGKYIGNFSTKSEAIAAREAAVKS